jgi:hypothetical protein
MAGRPTQVESGEEIGALDKPKGVVKNIIPGQKSRLAPERRSRLFTVNDNDRWCAFQLWQSVVS